MAAIVGTNVKVEVQAALGVAVSISALGEGSPTEAVATSTAHGLVAGDVIVLNVSDGMVQLDGQAVRVSDASPNAFALEGLDVTGYSAWTTGTFQKVISFTTLSSAQSVTMPNPAPAKLDTTTLIDVQKQYVYGLPDAPDGSFTCLFNPTGTAEGLIKTATANNATLVFRITFAAGQKTVFNANVSGGQGFDMQQNAVAHATIAFTPKRNVVHYAS